MSVNVGARHLQQTEFVQQLGEILAAYPDLPAQQLEIEVLETIAQGERLLDLGCDLAQGYCIARPMPAEDVSDWVAAWKPPSTWNRRAPILPCAT